MTRARGEFGRGGRPRWLVAAALVALTALMSEPAAAQGARVRVTRRAPVLESPRGDSVVLGVVDVGQELEVLTRQGTWYQIVTPAGMSRPRGWIAAASVALVGSLPSAAPAQKPSGRTLIRGFGEASGGWFNAHDSFETIVGSAFGTTYGAGAQVAFPGGAFVQASVERYRKTGSRVLVSGTQIYTLDIVDSVTVTPIEVTVGYRDARLRKAIPYAGVGIDWETLKEEAPTLADATGGHVGYHVVGGVEVPIAGWLWAAGEVEWTSLPKALGDTGISAAFGESDLGRVALRFKLLIGH